MLSREVIDAALLRGTLGVGQPNRFPVRCQGGCGQMIVAGGAFQVWIENRWAGWCCKGCGVIVVGK